MSVDVRVYLVTGEVGAGRSLPDVVAAAADGGATIVQLRDKDGDAAAVRGAAGSLAARLRGTGVPFVVNDDAQLAYECGAAGVHLGPDDVHPGTARELLGDDAVIGWSIHDRAQLAETAAVAACDYLAASPVWATPTKPDTTAPMGLDGLTALRDEAPAHLPLVAIGGIDESNAASVIEAGADGVAVVSAICAAHDPGAAARRLRAIVDDALARRSAR
ncbi:MAG: thiamine phosphate synthase [Streptosporangiaceae bacterium]